MVAPSRTPGFTYFFIYYLKLVVKDTLVTTVIIHVMDVYLNYVTVLMEYVIFKTYAKQDGSALSVTKVHVLYYINIVEKVGNVLMKLKKKKIKKKHH